jgi:hypothetical protein
MRSIRRFFALPAVERSVFLTAVPAVLIVRILLWTLPSRVIIRTTARLARGDRTATRMPRVASSIITRAVERASRRVPGATCLTQALSAQMILRHHGHHSRLCLGVARDASGDFRAHAWLESEGRILIGGRGVSGLARLPDLAATALVAGERVRE